MVGYVAKVVGHDDFDLVTRPGFSHGQCSLRHRRSIGLAVPAGVTGRVIGLQQRRLAWVEIRIPAAVAPASIALVLELLTELPRKLSVPNQDSRLDVPLLCPLGEVR